MTWFLLLFLIALYVRPQDWVPGVVGLPTHWILLPMGLVAGLLTHPAVRLTLRAPHFKLMLAYMLVIYVSTAINADAGRATTQFVTFFQRGLIMLLIVLAVSDDARAVTLTRQMLWLSMFLVFQGLLQYTTGESWGGMTRFPGYEEIRIRWYGDWDGPNVLGLLFTLSAAIAVDMAISGANVARRSIGAVCFCASFAGIFFTNSRGAFLGVIVMVAFYMRSHVRLWLAIPLAALTLAALVTIGPSRVGEISSSEASAGERVWLWEQGLTMLRENPVVGIGRGQFARQADLALIAHNNYVQNFAETGLAGFFCFVGLLWFSFKSAMIVQRPANGYSVELQTAARRLTAMIVAYGTTTFFVVMENDLLYVIFGLGAAIAVLADRQQPERRLLAMTRRDVAFIACGMGAIIGAVWLAAVKEVL